MKKKQYYPLQNLGVVFKCQENYGVKFNPTTDIFFDGRYEIYDLPENIRPTTRKEIQSAGLWDYVINKEDFSNVDEKLEEYLKIGEKVLEERNKS